MWDLETMRRMNEQAVKEHEDRKAQEAMAMEQKLNKDGYTVKIPKVERKVYAKAAERQHQRFIVVYDMTTGEMIGEYDAKMDQVVADKRK